MQHTEALEPDEWRSCFEALPAAERSRNRSDLVLSGLGAGLTLQELGDLFGVSRERIRQIARERGVSTKKLREEQRERAMHRRQTLAHHIHESPWPIRSWPSLSWPSGMKPTSRRSGRP